MVLYNTDIFEGGSGKPDDHPERELAHLLGPELLQTQEMSSCLCVSSLYYLQGKVSQDCIYIINASLNFFKLSFPNACDHKNDS